MRVGNHGEVFHDRTVMIFPSVTFGMKNPSVSVGEGVHRAEA